MKKYIIIVFLNMFCSAMFAQQFGTLKGRLLDTIGKQSLKDASISIIKASDSSKVTLGLAKQDGSFEIKYIPLGNYLIHISFQGYSPQNRRLKVTKADQEINIGTIYLNGVSDRLPDVVVTQSPIRIRNDTIEFAATQFTTKPNAVAEDLLKKMPGIDVGVDGTIKAQGETVSRVLVNGKRFFGDDPKMATRNLPPDVIDKIQVFDDLSDQSKFTGFDDGNRVKTLNIITKKNTNKGYFGKLVASDGTDGNYDESINIHRFDGNSQASLLGQANDINKQNFTQQDILGGNGPRGGGGFSAATSGSGSGITTTLAGGLNLRDSWGKLNSDAYGSYFFNDLKVDIEKQSNSKTGLSSANGSYNITNSTSSSISETPNHRFNFNLEENFDSSNSLVARPNFAYQISTPRTSSSSQTTSSTGAPVNSTVNSGNSQNSGYVINGANLQLRHKFKKKFRTISLDLNFSASDNNGSGNTKAINSFYGTSAYVDTLNQHYVDSFHSFTFSPTFSFTEPLAKNQILELRYNYNHSQNYSVNNTYGYNNTSGNYDIFDSLYSNTYKFHSNTNTLTLSYRLQKAKFNFNIGSGFQFTNYSSYNLVKMDTVAHNYINFTPTINFTYNFSKTKNFRLFYYGRTGQPSVSNLQPIKTLNGLDTSIGNPNLKPQFTNSLRMLYSSFDPVTQHVLFATINASMITNDIQNIIVQNPNGTNNTYYTNLNGTYNINGYFNYGFPLKKPKSNLNFSTNIGYSQSQNLEALLNKPSTLVSDYNRNTSMGETIKWTTNLKDHFDMNISAGTTYNIATNTLNAGLNSNYFVYTAISDFTVYTKGWILSADFTYNYYGVSSTSGYNKSVPLLTPSIAKQFLKNKAAELKFTIFDVLNENAISSTNISNNVITSSSTNVLHRYFMLTFTYNLRNFAGQQQRMPGMFRGRDGGFEGGGFPGGGGGFRRNN